MFIANYHTHTKRCGHATGEDEDYVLEALGHGYRYLGFSDHAMLPGFSEPYTRGDYSLFEDYCDSINALKKKYEDRMTIYLGIEAEAFPCYYPFFKELLANGVLDYMILGNHKAMSDDHEIYARFSHITSASQLYLYRDLAISAISSGMYSIFAHPDYFMANIENFDSDCKKVSKSLIETCMAYNVPLEVNVAGIRNGLRNVGKTSRWIYPTDDFFNLVSRYGAKCILGMDAHGPDQLADDAADFAAADFIRRHNLNVIDTIEIKRH
jgi:histidinol-phosphatase (PHP family)